MRGSTRMALLAGTALTGFSFALPAQADQIWEGGVSTDWFDPANWSTAVPAAADDIFIAITDAPNMPVIDGTAAVTDSVYLGDGGEPSGMLTIQNGGTLTTNGSSYVGEDAGFGYSVLVTGMGSRWDTAFTLEVGAEGTGSLIIADSGAVSSSATYVGREVGSIGMVTVTGMGSVWTSTSDIFVGIAGEGALTITNRGVVTASNLGTIGAVDGSHGTVTVDGMGSRWSNGGSLYVGDVGNGSLAISNGGDVSNTFGYIGASSTSSGMVTVDGAGSKWTSMAGISIASRGTGSLVISNGGRLDGGTAYIADDPGSTGSVTVTGPGSTWDNTAQIYVGDESNGSLTVSNGGAVSNAVARLGSFATGSGTVVVTGAGSSWTNSAEIYVGDAGTGSLTISNSGAVSSAGFSAIAFNPGSMGTVSVTGAGSSWSIDDNLYIADGGAGSLSIADGGAVDVAAGSTVQIADGGASTGTLNIGAASGDAAVGAGTLNAGAVVFGGGNGTLVFNHTDSAYIFAPDITGTGTILHTFGTTSYTGDGSAFGGMTSLTDGTLYVNDTLGGAVNVTGGTLGGSGTLTGNVTVIGGALAPGNSPGTLTIGGDLVLGSASSLEFELGDPSGTAGVDSDLINVGGNLTLDGTLDVVDAGGFGAGLYRLINYGGTLTDNGLDIGGTPAGYLTSDLTVQTSVANEINLVAGLPSGLSFWDGANMTANGAVDGGTGTWLATGTNWTGVGGAANGLYNPGVMQIFAGAAGTVTVDNSAGAISTGAMQFAVDGYTVTGGDLTLAGGAVARVGDGTSAGADFTTTIASNLIGSGSLEKTDLGELILTGANTYTGGTTISDGTLVGDTTSLSGDIVNNAALVFSQGAAGSYAGVISGAGSLSKTGVGALTLTGANTHGGGTTVRHGTLYVNGSIGDVLVDGGTLGGLGVAGDVIVGPEAAIAPGNSIGTLNVADITLSGLYTVELNDGGFVAGTNNDLINATGTANVSGGLVHVTPENGTDNGSSYTLGTYTILTAAGGVTGTFTALTEDYAFLDFVLGYDANNVYLNSSIAVTTFCLSGMTSNQCATGEGTISLGGGNSVFDAVLALSTAEAPGALDQLSGEIHASAKTAFLEDSRFAREAALNRLRVALGGVGTGTAPADGTEDTGLWAEGFGSWSRWNGDGNAATLDRDIGGLFVGGDGELLDNITFGLMGGYSRSALSVDDRNSSGTVDSYTLGAYAGGNWGAFSLKGGVAHSWHSLDTSRSVSFTGFSDSLSASYNARTFQAYTEAAYSIEYGNARFEPFANFAFVNLNTDGFTENGGAAALTASGQSSNASFTTLGIRGETPVALGEATVRLTGGLGWRHAFGDTPTSTHSFAAGGDAFTIAGVLLAREVLVLDAGFEMNLTDRATLGLSYNGQIGSGVSDHGARLGFNVSF